MLTRVAIQGLSILSDVSLELGPGLNVLTGEPGAGKSLLLTALNLLCGQKAAAGVVRAGAEEARVQACFRVDESIARCTDLAELGLTAGEHVWERVISRQGRSRARIGERAVPLTAFGRASRSLLTVTAQHAHVALGDPKLFFSVLDAAAQGAAREYGEVYAELLLAASELERTSRLAQRASRELEPLRADLTLLQGVDTSAKEAERLRERLVSLRAAEHVAACCARLSDVLSERDSCVERELRGLVTAFDRIGHVPRAAQVREALLAALAATTDAQNASERLLGDLAHEPGELERLEEQERTLQRLSRRFACEPEGLGERAAELANEIDELTRAEELQREAARATEALRERALDLARELHRARTAQGKALERTLARELEALGLGSARIQFALSERQPQELDSRGLTELKVLFAANVGEQPGELGRVASGGERSRILLALRCSGIEAAAPTLVLDEVDAGVGGAALDSMAQRLAQASRGKQIVCVTHHASVAAHADVHFRVHKFVDAGRTQVEVQRLKGEARVSELARMLAGARAQGAKPLARRLLEQATLRAQPAA